MREHGFARGVWEFDALRLLLRPSGGGNRRAPATDQREQLAMTMRQIGRRFAPGVLTRVPRVRAIYERGRGHSSS